MKGSPSSPQSPSWISERDALRLFGDRKTRGILAIFAARRSARRTEFFVHPKIASLFDLSSNDLSWVMDRLEGKLVEVTSSRRGKYRRMRLLPAFETNIANSGSSSTAPSSGLAPSVSFTPDEHDDLLRQLVAEAGCVDGS